MTNKELRVWIFASLVWALAFLATHIYLDPFKFGKGILGTTHLDETIRRKHICRHDILGSVEHSLRHEWDLKRGIFAGNYYRKADQDEICLALSWMSYTDLRFRSMLRKSGVKVKRDGIGPMQVRIELEKIKSIYRSRMIKHDELYDAHPHLISGPLSRTYAANRLTMPPIHLWLSLLLVWTMPIIMATLRHLYVRMDASRESRWWAIINTLWALGSLCYLSISAGPAFFQWGDSSGIHILDGSYIVMIAPMICWALRSAYVRWVI